MDEESVAELEAAILNTGYTIVAIKQAIENITGIKVGETTVRNWRRDAQRLQA